MALTHEKVGHTGQGLWHHKRMQLPAFVQHIANDLISSGHSESQAIQLAIGACQRWARGGADVHPDTRAKAIAALAEWERLKAQAKVTRSGPVDYDDDGLDGSWDHLDDLPDMTGLDVAALQAVDDSPAEPVERASKPHLGSGARFRALKAALAAKGASDPGALAAYIGRRKFGKARFGKLAAKARKGPAMSRSEIMRFYTVDDIHIVTRGEGDGSGRVVEAYAAVFGDPVPIQDYQGEYEEEIDRHAFDDVLARHGRRRGGIASAVRVLYNHGRTMGGAEAAQFQTPLGKPLEIIPDSRGLLTRTEYAKTPHAEEILELIRSGAITAQSFVGGIMRSDPALRGPGDKYRARGGALTRVRRLALGLREYGPVLYAAYPGAEVLGVRMGDPASYGGTEDAGFADDVTGTDAGDYPEVEEYAPTDGDGTGGVPEDTTSTRYHAHRLWQIRSEEMCRAAGIVPLRRESA
jgi:phage head maturation protease